MLLDNVSMGFNFSRPGQSSQTAIQGSDWLISQVKYTSIKLFFTADCQQDLFLHLVFSYPICVCLLLVQCRYKWGPLWRFPSSAQCFKLPQPKDRTPAGTRSYSCHLGEKCVFIFNILFFLFQLITFTCNGVCLHCCIAPFWCILQVRYH